MSFEEKIGQLISVGVNATFLNQDSDAFACSNITSKTTKSAASFCFADRFMNR